LESGERPFSGVHLANLFAEARRTMMNTFYSSLSLHITHKPTPRIMSDENSYSEKPLPARVLEDVMPYILAPASARANWHDPHLRRGIFDADFRKSSVKYPDF